MTPETAWAEAMKFENRANPYRFFDELRKTPVAHVGDGSYAITGFRELTTLLHDPRMSADLSKTRAPDPESKVEGGTTDLYGKSSFISMDPPEHDKARRQCMRHFGPPHTPGLVPSMEAGIQRLCNELLDKAKGKTRIDLVDDYAYPVPVWAICHILGVPLKDEPKFHAWIFDFMAGLTDPTMDMVTEEGKLRAKKGLDAKNALADYLVELIEGFRKNPTDAMFSKLVNDASGPDGPMSVADAAANGQLLLLAGHDSTVNTIAHTVLWVLRNPGTFELLRRRPELIPATIEESLRLEFGGLLLAHLERARRYRDRWDGHPGGFEGVLRVRRGEPRSEKVPQSEQIRHRTPRQGALRLGRRYPRLLRRSPGAAGGEPRGREFRSPRREPAARRRPAGVPV